MEDFRTAATLYYNNSSEEFQTLAKDYFHSMDADEDGRISQAEFIKFLEETGNEKILPDHFVELDKNGDGSLDFWEVVTMYYVATKCILCDGGCGKWLHGMYFTCLPCFNGSENSFNLCLSCYGGRKFKHCHNDHQFLDNYSLHNYMRESRRSSSGPNATQSEKSPKTGRFSSKILSQAMNVGGVVGTAATKLGSTAAKIGSTAADPECRIM